MLDNRTCDECLYGDKCSAHIVCRYFTPLDRPDGQDSVIEEYIEEQHQEYVEAFTSYLRNFENIL